MTPDLSALEQEYLAIISAHPGLTPAKVRAKLDGNPRLYGVAPHIHNTIVFQLRRKGLVAPHDWNRPGCWPAVGGAA